MNIDKYAENFDEHSVRGIRLSQVKKIIEKKNKTLDEFADFMNGQTYFKDSNGENCYFVRDIKKFINNK